MKVHESRYCGLCGGGSIFGGMLGGGGGGAFRDRLIRGRHRLWAR